MARSGSFKGVEVVDQRMSTRVDSLIAKGEQLAQTVSPLPSNYIGFEDPVSTDLYSEWRSQSVAFLTNLAGADHPYVEAFDEGCKTSGISSTRRGLGVLRAVRSDLRDGLLSPLRELLHASLFDDFLAMAEHLVKDGGYKDAAAVLAGSTLEEHLRKLCDKHAIPTEMTKPNGRTEPKKAAVMNDELKSGGHVSQIDWRAAQGWLDIRNDAAHSQYGNYVQDQIVAMIDGIRGFIDRNPA